MPNQHNGNSGLVEIGFEDFCDLLEACEIVESLDLGPTILHLARHVQHGPLLLVSTTHKQAAVLAL